nr:Tn3 family transposase [Sinorhizobium medicae]
MTPGPGDHFNFVRIPADGNCGANTLLTTEIEEEPICLPSGNWNDIRRLVTTIRSGQVRPSTLLAKLSAFPRQNGPALALRAILAASIDRYSCRQNPEMRRNATLHGLA